MKRITPKLGNWSLVGIVLALTILPLILVKGEFGGADGEAEAVITEIEPQYKPWFKPVFEPPSSEIENLLFVSQAALGAGLIGYAIGFYKGRTQKPSDSDKP
ncbi:MAG: energy-coupling factor ABC transporter substrate-binding protein [Jaaginema sp. PMC 1079.18]|nr:energy-coupling factor ABC transporter substrate-binding protein [Jaaginema sp. PMC 1080.18]MEC4849376.1 energy-coupling factor ABC transporter substrate-binding protein [Jaaginema sp. PMC 1079.18]MEC4865409.1 energy-coupling factor ABC transporter substrate-binding protein [Jaaginema sp. PMC 1078.18]